VKDLVQVQDAGRSCGAQGDPATAKRRAVGAVRRAHEVLGAQHSAPRRSGYVSLEEACEMVAELRDFAPGNVLKVVSRGPLLFFPGAMRNGDGSWRVPARDVRALLGDGVPVWERAVSARTFAGWCEVSARTVVRALNKGELRKVLLFNEWRIPVSEYARMMGLPAGGSSRGRLSFFAQGVVS
jgi:hypothetical protein